MNLRNKNVLVTGGAGFIGSHLCDALAREKPRRIIVIDNLFLGKESNLKEVKSLFPGLKFYKDSVTDYKRTKQIMSKYNIDVVFNLAVVPLPVSLIKPRMAFDQNVSSVLNLCELARNKYFRTLIHCSSSEAYGTARYVPMDEGHPLIPMTAYAASKAAGDQLCLSYAAAYGIDVAIARPFNNYGPRQNYGSYAGIVPIVITRTLSGKQIIIYGDGKQTRDFIFVKDTARALINIYKSKDSRNTIINIASGKEVSVNQLVKSIVDLAQIKKTTIRHIGPRPGDVRRHCADTRLARRLINFKPQIRMREGLMETIDWYKERIKK